MSKFSFKGTEKLYYPSLGVTVEPGATVELAADPGDGNWSPVVDAAPAAPVAAPTPTPTPVPDVSKADA